MAAPVVRCGSGAFLRLECLYMYQGLPGRCSNVAVATVSEYLTRLVRYIGGPQRELALNRTADFSGESDALIRTQEESR